MSSVLCDEVAVVTGGGTGIGLAISRRFVAEGAYVFVTRPSAGEVNGAELFVDGGEAQI